MERVIASWDEAIGSFIVSEASIRGLAGVRGETTEKFNSAVREAIPDNAEILVKFPDADEPVLLPPTPH